MDKTLALKFGETVMHYTEINRVYNQGFSKGYNRGVVAGVVVLIAAQQAYKHSDKIWDAVFGKKD